MVIIYIYNILSFFFFCYSGDGLWVSGGRHNIVACDIFHSYLSAHVAKWHLIKKNLCFAVVLCWYSLIYDSTACENKEEHNLWTEKCFRTLPGCITVWKKLRFLLLIVIFSSTSLALSITASG